eukprot:2049289-Prymnesium_polylepis.1
MRLMRSSDWNQRGRRAVPPAGPLPWLSRVVTAGGSGCGAVGCIWLRMSIQSSPSALYPTGSLARAARPCAPVRYPKS